MPNMLRLLTHVHGHFGWIAALLLAHPALLLGRPTRTNRAAVWSGALAVLLVTLTTTLGYVVYGPYRQDLRQPLFAEAPQMGWLFERKEHLAFGALVCAWIGGLAHVACTRVAGRTNRDTLRVARLGYALGALLAAAAAACATLVAAYRTF